MFPSSHQVLAWIDICAGLASRHIALSPSVTASVDSVHFHAPCYEGDILVLTSVVNRAFGSSMEIGVKVEVENVASGHLTYCCGAYLTFVSIDQTGKPMKVRPMVTPSAESNGVDYQRWHAAQSRREERLSLGKSLNHIVLPFDLLQQYSERHSRLRMASNNHVEDGGPIETETAGSSPAKRKSSASVPRKVFAGDTLTCTTHIVMPNHANTLKVTFGGQIMEWMEQCAYISASRFFKTPSVLTASVDSLKFLHPTRVGDLVYIVSKVTTAYSTSVEVLVSVYVQSYYSHARESDSKQVLRCGDPKLCNSGFLTLVAVNSPAGNLIGVKKAKTVGEECGQWEDEVLLVNGKYKSMGIHHLAV